jgi:ornithine cyclodeaminase/alanine dehydrogenase
VSGLYALFDPKTGLPVAVMDGGYLTLVRTAAVSALATRRLSRRDARTLGILGAGAQAEFHARFIATVRPIDRVMVWAREGSRARALLAALQKDESLRQVTTWTVCSEPHDPSACDVVVTATAAAKPVLEGRWLSAGSHVNSIGAHTRSTREIDATAVSRAAVLAVETVGTLAEAGDFQMAHEEVGGVLERVVTLSALLDPTAPPEPRESRDPSAITIFKSCGVAFEDLAVASLAFARAQAKGIGSRFRFA